MLNPTTKKAAQPSFSPLDISSSAIVPATWCCLKLICVSYAMTWCRKFGNLTDFAAIFWLDSCPNRKSRYFPFIASIILAFICMQSKWPWGKGTRATGLEFSVCYGNFRRRYCNTATECSYMFSESSSPIYIYRDFLLAPWKSIRQ